MRISFEKFFGCLAALAFAAIFLPWFTFGPPMSAYWGVQKLLVLAFPFAYIAAFIFQTGEIKAIHVILMEASVLFIPAVLARTMYNWPVEALITGEGSWQMGFEAVQPGFWAAAALSAALLIFCQPYIFRRLKNQRQVKGI